MIASETLRERASRYRLKAEECRALGAASTLENVRQSYEVLATSYDNLATEAELLHRSRVSISSSEPQSETAA